MLSIQRHTEQRQQQALSPRLQRAVWLLQLSSTDFAHEVQSVLGKNPFLEGEEGDGNEQPAATNGERVEPDRVADSADGFDGDGLDGLDGSQVISAPDLPLPEGV